MDTLDLRILEEIQPARCLSEEVNMFASEALTSLSQLAGRG